VVGEGEQRKNSSSACNLHRYLAPFLHKYFALQESCATVLAAATSVTVQFIDQDYTRA
jgi:hypothetical protein